MDAQSAFIMRGGMRIGYDHKAHGTNRQDAYYVRRVGDYAAGVVCDGSGGGGFSTDAARKTNDAYGTGEAVYSETGALRAARYLADLTIALMPVTLGNGMEFDAFKLNVFTHYVQHLNLQVQAQYLGLNASLAERQRFVENHLLHTVLILLAVPTANGIEGHILGSGDGYAGVDDQLRVIDQGDQVFYPAFAMAMYRGEPRHEFASRGFDHSPLGTDWRRAAICSDGLRGIQDQMQFEVLYGTDDDDMNRIQDNIDFGVTDGQFRHGDDLSIVSMERLEAGEG